MSRVFNTKGWVREGDVPPPAWSTKLKIIYGLKMSKHPISIKKGRTFYMTLYSVSTSVDENHLCGASIRKNHKLLYMNFERSPMFMAIHALCQSGCHDHVILSGGLRIGYTCLRDIDC